MIIFSFIDTGINIIIIITPIDYAAIKIYYILLKYKYT